MPAPRHGSTTATYLLLAANVLIYGLQMQARDALFINFALWPLGGGFQPWQIVSSAFLHGGLMHLFANMFGLWMFGRSVESAVGTSRFVTLYFASVLTAAITQLVVVTMGDTRVPTVGASGGLFGVLAAFAAIFPKRTVVLLFPPIPLPAPIFVTLYAAFELYAGLRDTMSGVAHFAHLGGLIGGLAVIGHWRSQQR